MGVSCPRAGLGYLGKVALSSICGAEATLAGYETRPTVFSRPRFLMPLAHPLTFYLASLGPLVLHDTLGPVRGACAPGG